MIKAVAADIEGEENVVGHEEHFPGVTELGGNFDGEECDPR